MITRRFLLQSVAAAAAYSAQGFRSARAENAPGVTDTEIKIGQTMAYSGPLSAYGVIGRTEAAYFQMINEQGGVNGRKINLISVDDAYSPPKTVEQVRRLVEQEQVAFLFQHPRHADKLGGPAILQRQQGAAGVRRRSGVRCSPIRSIFLGPSVSSRAIVTDAHIFAKHILATKPDAKIGVLYQNDAFGKDYLMGLQDVLGAGACGHGRSRKVSYEVSEPTVEVAGRHPARLGRRRVPDCRDAEIRRPGDP